MIAVTSFMARLEGLRLRECERGRSCGSGERDCG